jgi:NurA-like 5'-3' nuclease
MLAKAISPEDDKIQLIFSKINGPLKFEKSRMLARISSSELQHIPNNDCKDHGGKNPTLDNVCNVYIVLLKLG